MKNQKMRLIIGVVLGVVVLFYIGAMFGFFPFTICDDLVIRAVAFCIHDHLSGHCGLYLFYY